MPEDGEKLGLLHLPWELRSAIFIDVLKHTRSQEPILDSKFIKNRVRLRNRFDDKGPEHTNIYIEKPRCRYTHARALLATNRQIRLEINLLIKEKLKTGIIEIPFILDIMYVKDVGVFPTWVSSPYRTKRIVRLSVNIRIVRLDNTSIIPNEWIEAARYEPVNCSSYSTTLSTWNLFAVLVLHSLHRISIKFKPGTAETSIEVGDESRISQTGSIKRGPSVTNSQLQQRSQTSHAVKGSIIYHKSDVVDAYLLPIEATPYVIDELFIDIKSFEYQIDGKTITPGVEDSPKMSRFYKDGYVQFGRDVFRDFNSRGMDSDDIDFELQARASGRISSEQLQYRIEEILFGSIRDTRDHRLGLYHDILANSIGGVSISRADNFETVIMYKMTENWFYPWDNDYWFSKKRMKQEIAAQEAMEYPDTEYIEQLRTMIRRTNLGWPAQYEEMIKRENRN